MYHTYIDTTNDGRPFYVGMGTEGRLRRLQRNKHHTHVAQKHGLHRVTVGSFEERQDAVDLEIKLIAEHHTFVDDPLYNGIGCNYTTGGEGQSWTQEMRRKFSEAARGKTPWNKGLKLGPAPIEWRMKQSQAQMGQAPTSGMTGKQHTDETKAKMRKPHRCSICGQPGHKKVTCSS